MPFRLPEKFVRHNKNLGAQAKRCAPVSSGRCGFGFHSPAKTWVKRSSTLQLPYGSAVESRPRLSDYFRLALPGRRALLPLRAQRLEPKFQAHGSRGWHACGFVPCFRWRGTRFWRVQGYGFLQKQDHQEPYRNALGPRPCGLLRTPRSSAPSAGSRATVSRRAMSEAIVREPR